MGDASGAAKWHGKCGKEPDGLEAPPLRVKLLNIASR